MNISFSPLFVQAQQMDRMYRYGRHIYDFTRKYYLLGRDQVLDCIADYSVHRVLEVGCGTARNLVGLAQRLPETQLYGLDASREMLKTATRSLQRSGFRRRIILRQGLAEELDHFNTFDILDPFDVIFFSYSLSMIPSWSLAIDAALHNLKPGGRLYIVDFYDQTNLPAWFAHVIKGWLGWFDVEYHPELLEYLEHLSQKGMIDLTITPTPRRYAFIATAFRQ